MNDSQKTRVLDCIPPPDAIRSRLAEISREQAVLRRLLRASLEKEKAASQVVSATSEVTHAG